MTYNQCLICMDSEVFDLWSPVHARKKVPLCGEIQRALAAHLHTMRFNLLLKEPHFRQAEPSSDLENTYITTLYIVILMLPR
jgi:hypothetical protein